MFCEKCGAKLDDDALFCGSCGTKVNKEVVTAASPVQETVTEQAPMTSTAAQDAASTAPTSAAADKIKKLPTYVYGIAAAVLVAVVIVIVLVSRAKHTMNLNDYITVEFSGYETFGKADVVFDEDQFYADFAEKTTDKDTKAALTSDYDDPDSLEDWGSLFVTAFSLYDIDVDYELDKDSNLSNGDTVALTWEVDEESIKKDYGVRIKYENVEYEVSGLQEATAFDPFSYIEVTFSGLDGQGTADIELVEDNDVANILNYYFDGSSGSLSVGDTVTVAISIGFYSDDVTDYCTENFGMIPTSTSKEYVVESLDRYATTAADVSDELLAEIQEQATEEFNDYIEWYWNDNVTLDSLTYVGNYFINYTGTSSWVNKNSMDLIYQVDAHITDESGDSTPIQLYFAFVFKNVTTSDTSMGTATYYSYLYSDDPAVVEANGDEYYFDGFSDLAGIDAYIMDIVQDDEHTVENNMPTNTSETDTTTEE